MASQGLPSRTREAEAHFVRQWADSSNVDGLIKVIDSAVAQRRPLLAAQLFGLLHDEIDIEPGSALDRASRTARMWLQHRQPPEDRSWSLFEEAWAEARARRFSKIRQRQREVLNGSSGRTGRCDRRVLNSRTGRLERRKRR